ncbi:MAG: leucine-rich repeat protein [Clostridia bacterium]|nr:leucine-rich repeat protein [Clostridia bacterium]
MKKLYSLIIALCVIVCTFSFTACSKGTITYVIDGETFAVVKESGGGLVTLPQAPYIEGYTFDGWYTDEGSWENQFTSASLQNVKLESNMNVYAKYKGNQYKVTLDLNDGKYIDHDNENKSYTAVYGSEHNLPGSNDIYKLGYLFNGWSSAGKKLGKVWDFADDTTLHADWKQGQFDLTWVHKSGTTEINCYVTEVFDKETTGINLPSKIDAVEIYGIKEKAFKDLDSLLSATIGDSVTVIEDHAFSGCSKLESVTFPTNLTTFGNFVFNNCYRLTNTYIGEDSKNFYCEGGCLIEKATKKVAVGTVNSTIPEGIEVIGHSAFRQRFISNVTLPKSLIRIENYAFYDCIRLTQITIPDKVTYIGNCSFQTCQMIESITIPASVNHIGFAAFEGCKNLKTINFKGTKAQWDAITKGDFWEPNSSYTVKYLG